MMRIAPRAFALVVSIPLLSFASAAPASASTVRELVDRAVTELCPELLTYEGTLETEPKIVADGYEFIRTVEHRRAGTLDQVKRMVDDGEIYISNSRDTSFCQVAFSGEGSRAIFDELIVEPSRIAEDLFPDTAEIPFKEGWEGFLSVAFRTQAFEGQYLGVQFVDLGPIDPSAPLIIQQYGLEE